MVVVHEEEGCDEGRLVAPRLVLHVEVEGIKHLRFGEEGREGGREGGRERKRDRERERAREGWEGEDEVA